MAELAEMPLMLVAIVLSASWINQHFPDVGIPSRRLSIGLLALSLTLVVEISLGVGLRGISISEALLNRDPVSGTVYYAMLGVFAVMPWLLARNCPIAKV